MAGNKKPSRLSRIWQFSKPQLNYPPPRVASPSLPRFSLGGAVPTVPASTRLPALSPSTAKDSARQKLEEGAERRRNELRFDEQETKASQQREHDRHREWLQQILDAKYQPAAAKLEKQIDEKIAHLENRSMLATLFDRSTGRDAAMRKELIELDMDLGELLAQRHTQEEDLEQTQISQVTELHAWYEDKWRTLEATIVAAFEVGYFTDERAAAEQRGQDREESRGDGTGRERDSWP